MKVKEMIEALKKVDGDIAFNIVDNNWHPLKFRLATAGKENNVDILLIIVGDEEETDEE